MLRMMQASKCVETDVTDLRKCKLTAVYAESQSEKRERHDSVVTLSALEIICCRT